jgi:hypothetical protein
MPFRLLGFSCWDDRSGRFFLTGPGQWQANPIHLPQTDIFPRNGDWAKAANLLEVSHEIDPIW